MLRKALAPVAMGLLLIGALGGSYVGGTSDKANPQAPAVAFVTDDTVFSRLVWREYPDDRKFDRTLERIDREVSLQLESVGPMNRVSDSGLANLNRVLRAATGRALALPAATLQNDQNVNALARRTLEEGKSVYTYGDQLRLKEIGALLGVNLEETAPDLFDQGAARVTQPMTAERYTVVGVTKAGGGLRVHRGICGSSEPRTQREDALQFIVLWETQDPSSAIGTAGSSQAQRDDASLISPIGVDYDLVKGWATDTRSYYDSENRLQGRLSRDVWLYRKRAESDPDYDFFALEPLYQVESGHQLQGNDWWVIRFVNRQSMVHDAAELSNWSPGASDDESVALKTEADIVADVVNYTFEGRWYNETPATPWRPKPVTSWSTTETMAGINANSTVTFKTYHYYWLPPTSEYHWNELLLHDYQASSTYS